MSVTSISAVAIEIVTAIVLTIAAVVVVVGLGRAYIGRRSAQLVITDIINCCGIPAPVVAGLSPMLRRNTRDALAERAAPEESSLANTVAEDIKRGLVHIPEIASEEFSHVQEDIVKAPTKEMHWTPENKQGEVLSSPRDALAVLSGGIRTLAPERAPGLLGALSAALPEQRGFVVQPSLFSQQVKGLTYLGLTIDIGRLARGPETSATFWSDGTSLDVDDLGLIQRDKLARLLPMAATWISLYVIGMMATERGRRRRMVMRNSRDRQTRQTRRALGHILTAQWASWEMATIMDDDPVIALAFAEQALSDADAAIRAMHYYRPYYIVGTIYEHCSHCYEAMSNAESSAYLIDAYRSLGENATSKASHAYRQAEQELENVGTDTLIRRRLAQIKLRHLMLKLRMGRHQVPEEAYTTGLEPEQVELKYNLACLYASVAPLADKQEMDGEVFREQAYSYLIEVLLDSPEMGKIMVADPDLTERLSSQVLRNLEAASNKQGSNSTLTDRASRTHELMDIVRTGLSADL
jgi:hypothetical protein